MTRQIRQYAPKFRTNSRTPARRGMILMLVLALLAMFSLLTVTFMLSTSHMRRTAESGADNLKIISKDDETKVPGDSSANIDPHGLTEQAIRLLLSGGGDKTRNVLYQHSILENLYGHPQTTFLEGTLDTTNCASFSEDKLLIVPGGDVRLNGQSFDFTTLLGQLVEVGSWGDDTAIPSTKVAGINTPLLDVMGNVVTFTNADFHNRSCHIVHFWQAGTSPPIQLAALPEVTALLDVNNKFDDNYLVLSGDFAGFPGPGSTLDFIVNGPAFRGTGAGYDWASHFQGAALTAADVDGIPYILRPNAMAAYLDGSNFVFEMRDYLDRHFVPLNPDYTAPDLNSLFLAWYDLQTTAGRVEVNNIIPSFHRPALVRYWLTDWQSGLATPGSPTNVELENLRNLLRKAVLRPLPFDHPDFTGGNPMLSFESLAHGLNITDITNPTQRARIAERLAELLAKSPMELNYDIDLDGDGHSDAFWLDIGLPIREESTPGSNVKRKFVPLVAFLIRDQDGLVNLNAHGNAMHDPSYRSDSITNWNADSRTNYSNVTDMPSLELVDPATTPSTGLRGSGSGPAEIRLDIALNKTFHLGHSTYEDIFANLLFGNTTLNSPGRYGEDPDRVLPDYAVPGTPQQVDYDAIATYFPGLPVDDYPISSTDPRLLLEPLWMQNVLLDRGITAFAGGVSDLWGTSFVSYDLLGNRAFMPAMQLDPARASRWGVPFVWNTSRLERDSIVSDYLPVLFDNPYLMDPVPGGSGQDLAFKAEQLEPLKRVLDFDVSRKQRRLLELLTDTTKDGNPGFTEDVLLQLHNLAKNFTAHGSDIPVPGGFTGPGTPGLATQVFKCVCENYMNPTDGTGGTVDELSIAANILSKLPPEVLAGRKIDLNRLTTSLDVNAMPVAPSFDATTYQTMADHDYLVSLAERSRFAESIFLLLMVLCYDEIYGFGYDGAHTPPTPFYGTGVGTPYVEPGLVGTDANLTTADEQRRFMITRLAQWAVNLVDYLDADDASTPLVFDLDPFHRDSTVVPPIVAGWSVDANTALFINNNTDVINSVKAGASINDATSRPINLVWGMERPNILISETLALHNLKTADSANDDGIKKRTDETLGNGDPDPNPDLNFDQVAAPEASLFVELYNAADANRPDNTWDRTTGGTGQGKTSLVQWGRDNVTNAPVVVGSAYRLVVGETTVTSATGSSQFGVPGNANRSNIAHRSTLEPYSFTFQPLLYMDLSGSMDPKDYPHSHILGPSALSTPTDDTNEIRIDRIIWFHEQSTLGNTNPLSPASMLPVEKRSYWNDGNERDMMLEPNQYLVIGPRLTTHLSSEKAAADTVGDYDKAAGVTVVNPRASHEAMTIDLADLKVRKNNVPAVMPYLTGDDALDYYSLAYSSGTPVADSTNPAYNPYLEPLCMVSQAVVEASPGTNVNIGVNISGADNSKTGYYAALTAIHDVPYDLNDTANTHNYHSAIYTDNLYGQGTIPSYKPIFLQRLADPYRPSDPMTNPFITVDWSMIDLAVYSGEEAPGSVTSDPKLQAFPNPVSFASRQVATEPAPTPGGDSFRNPWSRLRLRSTDWQTPPGQSGIAFGNLLHNSDGEMCSPALTVDCIDHGETLTLGFLNRDSTQTGIYPLPRYDAGVDGSGNPRMPDHPLSVVPDDRQIGAPYDSVSGFKPVPFRVFPWNDAPLANTFDAVNVPASAPGRFAIEYTGYQQQVNPYDLDHGSLGYRAVGDADGVVTEHLLSFFHGKSSLVNVDDPTHPDYVPSGDPGYPHPDANKIVWQHQSLNLARFFDHVGLPSRYAGSRVPVTVPRRDGLGNPILDGNGNPIMYAADSVPKYREPGKMNLNTVNDVGFDALVGDHGAGGGAYREFHDLRSMGRVADRSITPPDPDPDPTLLGETAAFPFRAAGATGLVRDAFVLYGPDMAGHYHSLPDPNEAGLFRSVEGFDRPTDNPTNPFFSNSANSAQLPEIYNSYNLHNRMTRLSDMTTNRSNVFAVWMSVGLFEIEEDATIPCGYRLGAERGSDGSVEKKRYRSFLLIDRTIPVGFRRNGKGPNGQPLNIEDVYEKFEPINF